MSVRIQLRRDTQANWESHNPILSSGEMGIETDTNKFKFGNGVNTWNTLEYVDMGAVVMPDIENSEEFKTIISETIEQMVEDAKDNVLTPINDVVLNNGFATYSDLMNTDSDISINSQFNGYTHAVYDVKGLSFVNISTHWSASTLNTMLYVFTDDNNKQIKKVLYSEYTQTFYEPVYISHKQVAIPKGATKLYVNAMTGKGDETLPNVTIKSDVGEIFKDILDIKESMIAESYAKLIKLEKGFYHCNGTGSLVSLNTSNPVFLENYKGAIYDVYGCQYVNISTQWRSSDTNVWLYIFVDESGTVIKSASVSSLGGTTEEFIYNGKNIPVPNGAYRLYVNSRYAKNTTPELDNKDPIVTSEKIKSIVNVKSLEKKIDDIISNGTTSNGYSKKIKILFIGNSMTQDCTSYVPLILKNLAPELDFTIYNWYHASYTLAQHLADWKAGIGANILSLAQNTHSWSSVNKLMPDLLKEKFDIICLQEYFNPNRMPTYDDAAFATYEEVVNYIQDNHTTPFELVALFHQPHRTDATYNMDEIYKTTYDGIIRQLRETPTLSVIPSGIAMYYACKDEELNALGSAGGLSPDGVHAQEGLPCMIQAYVTAQWILEKVAIGRSILNDSTRVTASNYPSINVPGANGSVVEGTDSQYRKAQRLAMKAIKIGKHMNNTAFSEIEPAE